MSIKPLLNPDSTENKSLDLYCHSLTTATGGTDISLNNHLNVGGYMGDNPVNAGLNIVLDDQQLVRKEGKYVQITGKLVIQITNINFIEFRITFDNPVNGTVNRAYLVGSGVIPPFAANATISGSGVGVSGNNVVNIIFNNSSGAVFPASPTNITLNYSLVMLMN